MKLSFVNAIADRVRGRRRRRQRRRARHGLRQAHRPRLPPPRARAGAAAASRRTPGRCATSPRRPATTSASSTACSTVNEEQFEPGRRQGRRAWPAARVDGVTIAAWGLTFKANTDDLRDSPGARDHPAPARGRRRRGHRPTTPRSSGTDARAPRAIAVADDPYAACEGADVLVVLTEWDEFKWVDLDKVGRP